MSYLNYVIRVVPIRPIQTLTGGKELIRCDCLKKCITNRCNSVDPKMYCAIQDVTVAKPAQTNNCIVVIKYNNSLNSCNNNKNKKLLS